MTLFGIKASQNQNVVASGGTITDAGGFRRHQFNTSSTFTVSVGGPIEVAVIGGGGTGAGGGAITGSGGAGGGGGGGALRTIEIPAGSYSFTVGGVSGTSTFSHLGFTLTATGGGSPTNGVGSGGGTNFNGGGGGVSGGGGSGFTIWGTGYSGGGGVGAYTTVQAPRQFGAPGGFGGGGKGGDAQCDGGYICFAENGSPGSQRGAAGGGGAHVQNVFGGGGGSGIGGTVMFRYPI